MMDVVKKTERNTDVLLSRLHQPLRILHTESSMGMGGQEYRVLLEVQGMAMRGYGMVLAAPRRSPVAVLAQERGVQVHPAPMGNRGWMTAVPAYLKIIKQNQIDVIHTHGSQDSWTASIAGRLSFRRPLIVRTRHKSTPVSRSLRHHFLYEKLPHAVITTGEQVRQSLITRHKLNPAQVISIPTGVDLNRFRLTPPDASLRQKIGLREQGLVIGVVAFLRPEKGLEVLLDAVKLLKNSFPALECLIIGEGGEKRSLLARITKLKLEQCVHVLGFRDDIPALLALLDVVVIPSLSGEGVPQSLTQALAMARPVVASTDGGIPEVVEDGVTGLLVPPGNPVILSEKVAFILHNPSAGFRLGQAGRQLIEERYSLEMMLTRTENLYRRLLQSGYLPSSTHEQPASLKNSEL
jgi:glycosyltransferase involved in cell wall biosynthesis